MENLNAIHGGRLVSMLFTRCLLGEPLLSRLAEQRRRAAYDQDISDNTSALLLAVSITICLVNLILNICSCPIA